MRVFSREKAQAGMIFAHRHGHARPEPGHGANCGDEAETNHATGDAAAIITSTAHDFVIWGTRRRPWGDFVKISGDDAYAARFLDALNIF